MMRSLMQVYIPDSEKAVGLYQKAFSATLGYHVPGDDGGYYHAELDVYGQILAIADSKYAGEISDAVTKEAAAFLAEPNRITGNIMQFCLHFGEGRADRVRQGFEALREGSSILFPLGPTSFSPCLVDFIDQFGVRWCLFE